MPETTETTTEAAVDFDLDQLDQGKELPEVWQVRTLADADWAFSRLALLQRQKDENEELEEAAIARLKARTLALNAPLEKAMLFFWSRLQAFGEAHREVLLASGKRKSRALLYGVFMWRKQPQRLQVKDHEALLEWCRSQPIGSNVLRIKEEPALNEVQEWFRKTGEVPAGTEVKPEAEELTVKAVMEDAT
jgi:phage host-nuclease inhibitor protein Gam